MRARLRFGIVIAVLLTAGGSLAACGSAGSDATPPAAGGSPAATTTAPATSSPSESPDPSPGPGTVGACEGVGFAEVGSATVKYQGQPDPVRLHEGRWSDLAGNEVDLKACATGDLDGDGSPESLAALEFRPFDGPGRFWTLVAWHVGGDAPNFIGLKDLDDRTPVQSIDISGNVATVVWLTRAPGQPLAAVTIKRTSKVKLTGATLTEVSHVDEPYTPS
jgi:hypothetical protein